MRTRDISTGFEKVAVDFNRPNVRWLDRLSVEEAGRYLAQGQFGKGSMEPKIEASLDFLEHGGRHVIITNTQNMLRALIDLTGTHIVA
ncbi:MAG: hypothetical protein A3K46_06170 [Chloroflexi bacterium RBG_13_60_9]|nr:MAG: hypothetical protein A3K46_06170 [Chloroflexi bacterium RBG_13_60_9]